MDRANVIIVDHVQAPALKIRLENLPEAVTVVGATGDPDIGFTIAERFKPDLIMFNVDSPGDTGPTIAERFALSFPGSSLVLLTNSDSKKVLHLALQIGAKDVITLPVDDDRLNRAVQRILRQHSRRSSFFNTNKKDKSQFKTITVFSTKGGVGKTTIALNLALVIGQMTGKRTVAVDLDLCSGNLALMAGVSWKRSIKDLVDDIDSLDKELLDSYCAQHSSGLKILSAPVNPDFVGFIQAQHIENILDLLSQIFHYVVIDAPSYIHDTLIPALEAADDILIVTTLDLASVQNLKQCLDLLQRLSMESKARIVVNRAGYSGGLKIRDIENELGMSVQCVIPGNDRASIDAVNMGKPLYSMARHSQIGRRFEELARKLIQENGFTETRTSSAPRALSQARRI
ncbi:MAG TPA: MinD/ParA family protein [Firmicutes bacterium]|nr:MinD/ParA family protein [Bacillota bacterium]